MVKYCAEVLWRNSVVGGGAAKPRSLGYRMKHLHLVNIWNESDRAGGFSPMPPSLLWLPEGFRPGDAFPAFVFIQRWGGYPYDDLPAQLGEELATEGFAALSVGLRRRGMEGQLAAVPDDDQRDIKLAVDYLHGMGCRKIFLLGQELGGISALDYLARFRDPRVTGLCWIDPVEAPGSLLSGGAGQEAYAAAVARAALATRQGAGMDVRIDLEAVEGLVITQYAPAFLAWWGPGADLRAERALADNPAPLAVSAAEEHLPDYLAGMAAADRLTRLPPVNADSPVSAQHLVDWAHKLGAHLPPPVVPELVEIEADGLKLRGFLWVPQVATAPLTATLLVPGLTSSPLSPLLTALGPGLAGAGTAALAVELRRSGWAGHESSVLQADMDDIEAWVSFLVGRGFERIVLAGASMGSLSVGRFYSIRQHPNVVAIAHLMPTADCPDWFRRAAGDGPYEAAVAGARAAVAEGRGASALVDIDLRQPPPSNTGARFRWTQRAASWLSWWGPDADSRTIDHIANADVPLLLLSGSDDSYNDPARFAALRAAATRSPDISEIWYPGIDHGLAGAETRVVRDLAAWLGKLGLLA